MGSKAGDGSHTRVQGQAVDRADEAGRFLLAHPRAHRPLMVFESGSPAMSLTETLFPKKRDRNGRRRHTGMTNRQIGEIFGKVSYSAVA